MVSKMDDAEYIQKLQNEIEALRQERDEAQKKLDKWNKVMSEGLAGSEYINNPELYVERFRQLGEWHIEAVKRASRVTAKLKRAREDLEDLRWRLKPMNGVRVVDLDLVAEKVRRILADLDEGGDDAKAE